MQGLRFAVVLWGDVTDKCRFGLNCPVLPFTEVMARGRGGFTPAPLQPSDLATLVYTSGTTGKPKVCSSADVTTRSIVCARAAAAFSPGDTGVHTSPAPPARPSCANPLDQVLLIR